MSSDDALPEPDRAPGAPHPRETLSLVGHSGAVADFLEAEASGRLHHAWLLTGPRGVGKATLAWAIARHLLTRPVDDGPSLFGDPEPVTDLSCDPEHPVVRRMLALSEPGLFLLRRGANAKGDKLSDDLRVEEVRKLANFFAMSAADGGRRVVIVDSADEMNPNAANALLKMLEEPPANAFLLLISHQPSRLLPTIRSRCRVLRLGPLSPPEMAEALAPIDVDTETDAEALSVLAAGSVGDALRMAALGGVQIYTELLGILGSLPQLDRSRALKLAEAVATRGAQARLDLLLDLIDLMLARLARTGATGAPPIPEIVAGEADTFARLAPDAASARKWASLATDLSARARHARAVNIDPASFVLDCLLMLRGGV